MFKYGMLVGVAALMAWAASAANQTNPCGSAPSETQIARRRLAITVARQINTAEAQMFPASQKYFPLALLKGVTVPDGFEVQVSTDGESYAFSVKDTLDECHSAVFSDQKGLIYTGMALR